MRSAASCQTFCASPWPRFPRCNFPPGLGYIYDVSVSENGQMGLPFGWDEKSLGERLHALTGRPLSITVTRNSVSVLSMRRSGGGTNLRIHGMFLRAGMDVISEIARFIKNGKKGERFPVLSRFIRENIGRIKKPGPERAGTSRPMPKTAGRFHDLIAAYDAINRQYFDGRLLCDIGWGRMSRRYGVRKRTLGSYSPPENGSPGLIRINPVLDRRGVPSYYVRFVVYHEMLHAHLGVGMKNGRRRVHSPEFRGRERLFREYQRAMAWEKRRDF